MKYTLKRTQQLYCDIETAWSFFSSARNLAEITPKQMRFEVLTDLDEREIFEGMYIDYHVSPLLGIRMYWQTEIVQVDRPNSFVDLQRKGPYKLWHHRHEFIPNTKGVLMYDTVDYELPFGLLGDLTHILLVKKKLQRIFDYRYEVLEAMFNR